MVCYTEKEVSGKATLQHVSRKPKQQTGKSTKKNKKNDYNQPARALAFVG